MPEKIHDDFDILQQNKEDLRTNMCYLGFFCSPNPPV
jgi:hypothetical protein